jgi:hypothetical protein
VTARPNVFGGGVGGDAITIDVCVS